MWLIDTTTLRLVEVRGPENQPYVALSHTWIEGEEVSFQEIWHPDTIRQKAGWAKITNTCRLARERDPPILFAWVDTCCIDKTSSASLSEAINSMFFWYQQAAVCYVYLSDLRAPENPAQLQLEFCRWFGRGWTLQELIAPSYVEFYDKFWICFGTKASLSSILSSVTRIDPVVLADCSLLPSIPVARRMSWAATRKTTRTEDLAYCLFGIFNVHLPLIYGEGEKAFIRLQEAIAQDTPDLTLFAWTAPEDQKYRGILARSPEEFKSCDDIHRVVTPADSLEGFAFTNNGLQITTNLHPTKIGEDDYNYLMDLKCVDLSSRQSDGMYRSVYVRLAKCSRGYIRYRYTTPVLSSMGLWTLKPRTIRIPKLLSTAESQLFETTLPYLFSVVVQNQSGCEMAPTEYQPDHLWNSRCLSFITERHAAFTASIKLKIRMRTKATADVLGFMSSPPAVYPLVTVEIGLGGAPRSTRHPVYGAGSRILGPWSFLWSEGGKPDQPRTPPSTSLTLRGRDDLKVSVSTTTTQRSGFETYGVVIDIRKAE